MANGAAVGPAALWALASLRTVELLGRRARSHGPTALLGAGSRAVVGGRWALTLRSERCLLGGEVGGVATAGRS